MLPSNMRFHVKSNAFVNEYKKFTNSLTNSPAIFHKMWTFFAMHINIEFYHYLLQDSHSHSTYLELSIPL